MWLPICSRQTPTHGSRALNKSAYVGHSIKRIEDLPLLRGRGRFLDDLQFSGHASRAFVRSPHAHALIRGIDASAAASMPGVHAVLTLADLAPHLSQERLPLQFRSAQLPPDITPFVLAKDEVAFVGEAVAMVVAETRYLAEDAAALVAVDYELLPAVSDCRAAAAPGAPHAHRGRKSNVMTEITPVLRRHRHGLRQRPRIASASASSSIAAAPIRSKAAACWRPTTRTTTA